MGFQLIMMKISHLPHNKKLLFCYYCLQAGVPVGLEYYQAIRDYEAKVQSKR